VTAADGGAAPPQRPASIIQHSTGHRRAHNSRAGGPAHRPAHPPATRSPRQLCRDQKSHRAESHERAGAAEPSAERGWSHVRAHRHAHLHDRVGRHALQRGPEPSAGLTTAERLSLSLPSSGYPRLRLRDRVLRAGRDSQAAVRPTPPLTPLSRQRRRAHRCPDRCPASQPSTTDVVAASSSRRQVQSGSDTAERSAQRSWPSPQRLSREIRPLRIRFSDGATSARPYSVLGSGWLGQAAQTAMQLARYRDLAASAVVRSASSSRSQHQSPASNTRSACVLCSVGHDQLMRA
jgi:hypothetical protein